MTKPPTIPRPIFSVHTLVHVRLNDKPRERILMLNERKAA